MTSWLVKAAALSLHSSFPPPWNIILDYNDGQRVCVCVFVCVTVTCFMHTVNVILQKGFNVSFWIITFMRMHWFKMTVTLKWDKSMRVLVTSCLCETIFSVKCMFNPIRGTLFLPWGMHVCVSVRCLIRWSNLLTDNRCTGKIPYWI